MSEVIRESVIRFRIGHHLFRIWRREDKRNDADIKALVHEVPPKSLDQYTIMIAKARMFLELPGVTAVEVLDASWQGEKLTKVR